MKLLMSTVAMFSILWPNLASAKETLRVELIQSTFDLALDDKYLIFRSKNSGSRILRSACNEGMIKEFWSKAANEVSNLPKIKNKHRRPAAILNGQRHWIIPQIQSPAAVRDLDHIFRSLQFKEVRKCRVK